ncbi:MAG: hypothetical protein ACOX8O_02695 [Christensenellales bacterium]|jgi:hypothetical protein|nr:hypothetical protein [Clostridiales bacterium]
MEKAVNETLSVTELWRKKAEAVQAIYLLTLEQSKACAAEDMKRLDELLERRQGWMERVDTLDEWLAALDGRDTAQTAALKEEVKALLIKTRQVDAYNRKLAADKLQDIKNGIRDNTRLKQGMRSYIRGGVAADGMYFDTKK